MRPSCLAFVACWLAVGCGGETGAPAPTSDPIVSYKDAAAEQVSKEREEAIALTKEILKIDIPPRFEPHSTMHIVGDQVNYFGKDGGMLVIMRASGHMASDDESAQRMAKSFAGAVPDEIDDEDVKESSSSTKFFTIGGKPCEFQFRELSSVTSDSKSIFVGGAFKNAAGRWVGLNIVLSANEYDESEIDAMIRSIE